MILRGVRVVELATFVFGPAAGTVMADFGADVVKIEHPVTGDPYRYLYRLKPLPECEENYCWILDSRGKRSVALDCKREEGRAVATDLAAAADVLITNLHPSVLAALRMRWEDLAPRAPRLVYAHATGYGEAGAEAEKPGLRRDGVVGPLRHDGRRPAGRRRACARDARDGRPSERHDAPRRHPARAPASRPDRPRHQGVDVAHGERRVGELHLHPGRALRRPALPARLARDDAERARVALRDGRRPPLLPRDDPGGGRVVALPRGDRAARPGRRSRASRRSPSGGGTRPRSSRILDDVFRAAPLAAWRERLDRHKITFGVITRERRGAGRSADARQPSLPRDRGQRRAARRRQPDLDRAASRRRRRGARPRSASTGGRCCASSATREARIEELVGLGIVRRPAL